MKTITEYRPLVFSVLSIGPAERALKRRQLLTNAAIVCCYCLLGGWVAYDTGFTPLEWQFWACFGPLLVGCELSLLVRSSL